MPASRSPRGNEDRHGEAKGPGDTGVSVRGDRKALHPSEALRAAQPLRSEPQLLDLTPGCPSPLQVGA